MSALKLLLSSYLSEEAPPFYFPNVNIRVHSSSCSPANSHSSSCWLVLVQPSGIRSYSASSTCPLPCDYNQSECQCRKAACPEIYATLWLCFPISQHLCLDNFPHLQAASSLVWNGTADLIKLPKEQFTPSTPFSDNR